MTMFRVLRCDDGTTPTFIADIEATSGEEACRKAAYHDPARGIVGGKSFTINAMYEAYVRANATVRHVPWHDGRFFD